MTNKQTWLYWKEFNAAVKFCRENNLPVPDRHELHRRALKGKDKSSKLFTNEDLDEFLKVVRAISRPDDLNAQMALLRQGQKRLIHRIMNEQVYCLAAVTERPGRQLDRVTEDDTTKAVNYIVTFITDRFHNADLHQISYQPVEREGGAEKSDLELVRDTLDARINELRNKAGMTIHDMLTAAELVCKCRRCVKKQPVLIPA